ncbi:MAG: Rec8 like protein-domain-containing protein [Podila humilis]|nr:MAG: Rec8 like protein-domain-containing protein [Podila humilis]
MFYSKEILARKDTNLGRIWLAATIGPRSGLNRLSKKEVNGVDIVRTCRDISQPPEPLALRLSSNLLMGVVRVYSQQVLNYAADVNSTWARIKRDLALVQAEQLELTNPVARLEAITNDYDMDIEQDLTRPNNLLLDWDLEVARNDRYKETAIEFGWALPSQVSMDDSSDNFSIPNVLLFDKTDERRRRITLDEDTKMKEPARYDFGDRFDLALGDEDLAGDNGGLYLDAEGNLVEAMPDHGLSTADMGGTEPPIQEDLQIEKTKVVDHGEMEIDNQLPIVEQNVLYVIETDNIQPSGTEINPVVPQKPTKVSHQGRKAKGLIVDECTTLLRDELTIPRNEIELGLARSRSNHHEIGSLKATKVLVDSLFQGPFCVSGYAPELGAFWETASARPAHSVPSLLPPRPPDQLEKGSELPRHFDHDMESLGGDIPDPEVIRRQHGGSSEQSTPGGLGLGSAFELHDEEAGMGPMPWSRAYNLPASAGGCSDRSPGGSDHGQEFHSIFNAASVIPRKRSSMGGGRTRDWGSDEEDGEDRLIRRRHHQGGTESATGFCSDDAQFTFGSEDAAGLDNDATSQPQETGKFLEYVRTMLQDAGASRNSSFSFSDVVPVQERRQVAASAFYHILALSSAGVVRPCQDEPYGDIQVAFCKDT